MSLFALRVKSERKAQNKKKVQLIERGKEEVLTVRRTENKKWKFSTALT